MRYWCSWWTGNYADEGCTSPPYQVFVSGYRDRNDGSDRDEQSVCALFDAPDEATIRAAVAAHFPDAEWRFVTPTEADWLPNDRFPGARANVLEGC